MPQITGWGLVWKRSFNLKFNERTYYILTFFSTFSQYVLFKKIMP